MVAAVAPSWRLTPLAVVRSTGFPIQHLESLRADVDEILERSDVEIETLVAGASSVLADVGGGRWRRQAAQRLIEAQPLPSLPYEPSSAVAAWIERYHRALAARDERLAGAAARFDEQLLAARRAVSAACASDALREVLFASSETAAAMGARLVSRPIAPNTTSAQRADEDRAVLFLQRLCAKNETASFYGPVFWARLDDRGERFEFVPGEGDWLKQREVYIEHWATRAIALAIGADPEVHPFLRARLNPSCRVEGSFLHYPVGKQLALTPPLEELLMRAREGATISELRALDVELTDVLSAKRILEAEMWVPTVLRCDDALEQHLAALPPACPGRARWLERLQEFSALRERYRRGDLGERAAARQLLEGRFNAWTASAPRRGQGRMFVGRNVVHEVCGRNVSRLDLGPLAAEIETGLAPLCELARWAFVWLARSYEARMLEVLRPRLDEARPPDLVEALRLWQPHEQDGALEQAARAALLDAWSRTIGEAYHGADEELEISQADVARVRAHLPEPDGARADELVGADFHSPDLLVAAASAEAIRRGDYRIVVGELHAGVFAVASPIYQPFCPWPELFFRTAAELSPDPLLHLVDPPDTYNYGDLLWPDVPMLREVVHQGACARFGREVPVAELRVVADDGRLYVETLDGKVRQRLLSLYQSFLHRRLFALPLLPFEGDHASRVRSGRLVLRRRSWRLGEELLPSVSATEVRTLDGYRRLRRWQRDRGLPDRIFVKLASEPKPVLVDFRAPLLCAAWLRLAARRSGRAAVSEMLPSPEQMWLIDDRGRFSSELRFTMARR